MTLFRFIWILCLLSPLLFSGAVQADDPWTGPRIMMEVSRRHEPFPYRYEELTMILMDRAGNRDVRKARHFSRVEEDGSARFLLVFDTPPEVRGVALAGTGHASGPWEWQIYLPALGKRLLSYDGRAGSGRFLGTDFTVTDLRAEALSDFRYVRAADQKIDLAACYVIEAVPRDREVERATGYSLRRHFVRQDNFFIVRTDYYGRLNRFFKRRTFRDLKRVDGDTWHADMILMENIRERHMTLIKTDRRVFSRDYVPPEMFTSSWLLENRHIEDSERILFQGDSGILSPSGQDPERPADVNTDP
jgi:hypothetical protein